MTQLAVSGLRKAFAARPVLDGIDLDVPDDSLTAILGPSGSGKTTLLRVIAGFEQADSGTVRVGGRIVDGPADRVPPERRRVGYVPQDGALFPHLTVAANIGFGLPRRERRSAVIVDLLDAVGMAGLGERYPHQLSGGQQQRVALARALAIKPSLVLLDEPFSSLDASLRATIRADVRRLLREAGATAVLVTHDQDEALSIADQVAVIRHGKIAQCSTPEDLYTKPADPDLAQFIGQANLLEGVLGDGAVETILGPLQVQPTTRGTVGAGPVTVLVRPEQITISGSSSNGSAGLAGWIVSAGYHGHDAVVYVKSENRPDMPEVIVRTLGGCELPAGSPVTLRASGPVLAWPANGSSRRAGNGSAGSLTRSGATAAT
ncbi:MAG: ABC transporter ATP-binding protein [Streptosporangiaceae bacterium]|jgi:iron(III) transport system ATP-binding protein